MWCSRYFLCLVLLASLVLSILPFSSANPDGCSTCPSGHYCEKTLDSVNTLVPCPAGTYSASTGRASAQACRSCPAGYFCAEGTSNFESSRCPAGAFCPEGTRTAVACPPGTFQPSTGASSLDECLPCPAGSVCASLGTVVPSPCPLGKHCPGQTWQPLQCPPGHYCPPSSALHGAAGGKRAGAEALSCPAGYYCGPVDAHLALPCPVGTFCSAQSATPEPCPAGFAARVDVSVFDGARDSLDAACVACPAGTWQRRGDTTGACEPCPAGHTCPGGVAPVSAAAATASRRPVVEGAEEDTLCPPGHYCPSGSAVPVACPAGTFNPSRGAGAVADCFACPTDMFSSAPGATHCRACPSHSTAAAGSSECKCSAAGRVFMPADRTCRCKPGFLLSPMAALAQARAKAAAEAAAAQSRQRSLSSRIARTLSKLGGAADDNADEEDEDETAAFVAEAAAAISLSDIELSAYDCREIVYERCAAHEIRAANGKCVDRSGAHCADVCGTNALVSSVSTGSESSDAVLRYIALGTRTAAEDVNGTYSKPATSALSHGHYFDAKLGLCQCRGASTLVEDTCDANCRALAPTVRLAPGAAGALDVVVSVPNEADPALSTVYRLAADRAGFSPATIQTLSCTPAPGDTAEDGCLMHLASVSSRGVGALFNLPSSLVSALSRAYPKTELSQWLPNLRSAATSSGARSLLAAPGDITVYPAVFCLQSSESLVFEFSPATGSYPVYDTASLLNTNPSFDYSLFSQLPSQYPNPAAVPVALFGYTFTTAGTYVFTDSTDADKVSIVRVLGASQQCPAGGLSRVSAISASTLALLGVTESASVHTEPNWALIGVLLGIFVVLILIVLFSLCCLQHVGWATAPAQEPVYRKEAQADDLDVWTFSTKGTVTTIQSRSDGKQALELDKDDLIHEAVVRATKGDKLLQTKLKYLHFPHDPELNEDEKRLMNELTNYFDYEEIDFHTLYKKMEDMSRKMRENFTRQSELLHVFYFKTEQELEHLKSLLSIKMHVQMQKTGEGFAEAVNRLVSGELFSRQAFSNIYSQSIGKVQRMLDDLHTLILGMTIDCNIDPIMQLLKEFHEIAKQAEQRLLHERSRRKTFAAHVEIVGRDIVASLAEQDHKEAEVNDDYWHIILFFDSQVQEVRSTMQARRNLHLQEMTNIMNEDDRRLEQLQYHRAMAELVHLIQVELKNILERLVVADTLGVMDRLDVDAHELWVMIHQNMITDRLHALRNPAEGRFFRGINPDLAKVLTGCMGMLRSGIKVNPKTGCYEPRAPFDPSDPFQTITDPGDVYREWYEQQLQHAIEQMRWEADEARREAEEEEFRRREAEEEARLAEERELELDIETHRQNMEDARDVNVDTVLHDLQARNEDDEDVKAVTDTLEKDQNELLATLMERRAAIEADESLDPEEKERLLKVWDDKIHMLQQMLKDEALSLITYLQSESKPEATSEAEAALGVVAVDDPDLAPSVREVELNAELLNVKAQLERLREELSNISALPEETATGDDEEEEDAEAALNAKENEMLDFERANAEKLQELDEILRQRRQNRLMGEMGDLDDDDMELDEEYRALQQARLAHAEELAQARNRVEAKRQDVHNRQEAKRKAIAEAEQREAELKRELLEAEDEDLDDLDDEARMLERKRRFEDAQRQRRDAELSRLDEEQRRAIAQATDAAEAKRLVKEFEMNKLAMQRKLASDEDAQRARLDEALRRRDEARRKAQQKADETPAERLQRKARVMEAIAHGEDPEDDDELTPRNATELIIEGEDEEAVLATMAAEDRDAYLARKAEREQDRELRFARRREARRKRLEAQEKEDFEREKTKEMDRLQRIHHDMELDLIEDSLLKELEAESRALVDEAMGLAGIEVWNTFAAHSRKLGVENRIERVKQQMEDAKEANEERTMEEAQRLLKQAAKEKDDLMMQLESEQNRQAKLLQERLAARKKQNTSKLREERDRRKREEAARLEDAQHAAELNADLQIVRASLALIPEERRKEEARRVIEAELNGRHVKEKKDLLATQSAERRMFWKEQMLENADADPEEVQRLAGVQFDAAHSEQLHDIEARHIDDVKALYLKLFPGASVSGPEWSVDAGKHAIEELARKKQALLDEEKRRKEEEYERKKKELEEKERRLEEEQRRKLEQLQSKKASDDAEYSKLLADHDEKLMKGHRALLERKKQMLDAEMAAVNQQDEDMRKRMVQQHQEEMARYEAALKEEYQRQKQAMVKKLQARRALQSQRKVEDDRRKREDEKRRRAAADKVVETQNPLAPAAQGLTLQTSEQLQQGAIAGSPGFASPLPGAISAAGFASAAVVAPPTGVAVVGAAPALRRTRTNRRVGSAAGGDRPVGMTPEQWDQKLKAEKEERDRRQQELELKAKSFEMHAKTEAEQAVTRELMAEKLAKIEVIVERLDAESAAWRQSYYVDEKEISIKPLRAANFDREDLDFDGTIDHVLPPEPKHIAAMTAREFVLYRFGCALIKLLAEQDLCVAPPFAQRAVGEDSIVLMVATGLPQSKFKKIAFPNSYQYDAASNRLWIRHERLVETGEFVLVLLHALAHIHVTRDGEEWDDRSPIFLGQFYKLLRLVCSDMFFSRSRGALQYVGEPSSSAAAVTSRAAAPAIGYSSDESKEDEGMHGKDDTEFEVALLPTTYEPRIPKVADFALDRVDFAEQIDRHEETLQPAVDDLIDIHVSLVDVNNAAIDSSAAFSQRSGSSTAVIAASNGMEYFSTHAMLRRIDEYQGFASSARMRDFLVRVEQKAAGYDRTREVLARDVYKNQANVVARVASRENEHKLTSERADDKVPVSQLSNLADELNRQFLSVIDQLYESSARLQQLQKRTGDGSLSINKRAELNDKIAAEKVVMARLDRERLVTIQRLRHLENKDIPTSANTKERRMDATIYLRDAKASQDRAEEANARASDLGDDLDVAL